MTWHFLPLCFRLLPKVSFFPPHVTTETTTKLIHWYITAVKHYYFDDWMLSCEGIVYLLNIIYSMLMLKFWGTFWNLRINFSCLFWVDIKVVCWWVETLHSWHFFSIFIMVSEATLKVLSIPMFHDHWHHHAFIFPSSYVITLWEIHSLLFSFHICPVISVSPITFLVCHLDFYLVTYINSQDARASIASRGSLSHSGFYGSAMDKVIPHQCVFSWQAFPLFGLGEGFVL